MFTLAFHRSSSRPIATTSSGDPPSTNPNLKIEIAQTGWQVPPLQYIMTHARICLSTTPNTNLILAIYAVAVKYQIGLTRFFQRRFPVYGVITTTETLP